MVTHTHMHARARARIHTHTPCLSAMSMSEALDQEGILAALSLGFRDRDATPKQGCRLNRDAPQGCPLNRDAIPKQGCPFRDAL